MSDSPKGSRPASRASRANRAGGPRPGRQALFSDPSVPPDAEPLGDVPAGRRALFSPDRVGPDASQRVRATKVAAPPLAGGAGAVGRRGAAVVHCRTCLAATEMSLPSLGLALVPSLWIPTRPWPRLMRCPACHRVSWCRIDWPGLR